METIDPKTVGLSSRDHLMKLSDTHWAVVIDRKSRIIMTDGRRILEKIRKIRNQRPELKVSLKTRTPVCSKTTAYLKSNGVDILT